MTPRKWRKSKSHDFDDNMASGMRDKIILSRFIDLIA